MTKELKEYFKTIDGISHVTFDPKGPDVARIHLIPPKKVKIGIPWVVLINGEYILPITCSWAVLLREFINNVNVYEGREILEEETKAIVDKTLAKVARLYPKAPLKIIKSDLQEIIEVITAIANGKKVNSEIGYMSLKEYSGYMKAPHRMDLMISSMEKDGHWHCNQKCLNCYAANETKAKEKELSTDEWKRVIDILKEACVPQITFTGGEPTLRDDLVELVKYSGWFVTRLNTNGQLLTKELCKELYDASLDNVQVTVYSSNSNIHNILVGTNGFDSTMEGLDNAVKSGLLVSVNTPLCKLNKDYLSTVKYLHEKYNVRYFTCSGLILTGAAKETSDERLTEDELVEILRETKLYCLENGLDLKFTSPGWIEEEKLKKLKMSLPMCGACLSNMAISPSGDVIPCQSYLDGTNFGNILTTKFSDIWNNKELKKLRNSTLTNSEYCPLNEMEKHHEENN